VRLALVERFAFGRVGVGDHDRMLGAVLIAVLRGFGDVGADQRRRVELTLEHDAVAEDAEDRVHGAVGIGVAADVVSDYR